MLFHWFFYATQNFDRSWREFSDTKSKSHSPVLSLYHLGLERIVRRGGPESGPRTKEKLGMSSLRHHDFNHEGARASLIRAEQN
jgi:hypothetical protein